MAVVLVVVVVVVVVVAVVVAFLVVAAVAVVVWVEKEVRGISSPSQSRARVITPPRPAPPRPVPPRPAPPRPAPLCSAPHCTALGDLCVTARCHHVGHSLHWVIFALRQGATMMAIHRTGCAATRSAPPAARN